MHDLLHQILDPRTTYEFQATIEEDITRIRSSQRLDHPMTAGNRFPPGWDKERVQGFSRCADRREATLGSSGHG